MKPKAKVPRQAAPPVRETSKPRPAFKLWLETEEGYVFGQGALDLLQKIQELGTLSRAAEDLGMSYRHAWGLIKKIEGRIGEPILFTHKGGRLGGGGARLTPSGRRLIREFLRIKDILLSACKDDLSWEGLFVKISARNRIEGKVVSVEKGDVAATVKIQITTPTVVTAFITREAVEDLGIEDGDRVAAVVKATEVMVSKETE